MKIKSIEISGYRQIKNLKINLEDDITIIAGANNSGKTSLVELFTHIFGPSKGKLCCDDLSVINCYEWSNQIFPLLLAAFTTKTNKEEIINEIYELVFSPQDQCNTKLVQPIEIKLHIAYEKETDDIRNIADYIMDFSEECTSVYFFYQYAINPENFKKNFDDDFEKFRVRFSKLSESDIDDEKKRILSEMMISLYAKSSEETVFFCDKDYDNRVRMEMKSFKSLFNYRNIMAGRTLDDENSDRTQILSKNMIEIASEEDDWNELLSTLPDEIIQPIQEANIQEKVRSTSLDSLRNTMESITKTNGGHTGNIIIDMTVTEDSIQTLLKNITCAKYQMEGYCLKESSQGLGYSNLIFIHLQLEKFKKTVDPLLINFFVIEEPESHMHPQMQHVFTEYLLDFFKNHNDIQGCITTHSHEVIHATSFSKLRVLRQPENFNCKIYDLRQFYDSISDPKQDSELPQFYDWFFTINFPDIIFADKIILYEGDTERMLIKTLLLSDKFTTLRNQYISFIQVGGAYAFNYVPIIKFLEIKTAILTDLDYDKNLLKIDDILSSRTTNSAINMFSEEILGTKEPTIKELYSWQKKEEEHNSIIVDKIIYLAFQGKDEGYSRTLEEAMLSKYLKINSFDTKQKNFWKDIRNNSKLKFTIPSKGDEFSIRDIVLHTANGKTDFMYSVILNNRINDMLPDYIIKALTWLTN